MDLHPLLEPLQVVEPLPDISARLDLGALDDQFRILRQRDALSGGNLIAFHHRHAGQRAADARAERHVRARRRHDGRQRA